MAFIQCFWWECMMRRWLKRNWCLCISTSRLQGGGHFDPGRAPALSLIHHGLWVHTPYLAIIASRRERDGWKSFSWQPWLKNCQHVTKYPGEFNPDFWKCENMLSAAFTNRYVLQDWWFFSHPFYFSVLLNDLTGQPSSSSALVLLSPVEPLFSVIQNSGPT